GADITVTEDGWVINGPRDLEGARVDSGGDHRVALALAVAGLLASGKTEIEGAECVDISYPGFFADLERLSSRSAGPSTSRSSPWSCTSSRSLPHARTSSSR